MNSHEIAGQLVRARLRAEALHAFPNGIPGTLDAAYATQDCAIGLWPDHLAGWKVGRIDPPWLEQLGEDRLVGPIFARSVRHAAPGEVVEFPVFEGGFAAVEAEFVFRLTANAQRDKATWTIKEAAQLAGTLHVGIETAGSPLAAINDLGPLAVVCDFGNNTGLLLGPEVIGWRERQLAALTCETLIEERVVGRGGALSVPGGPLAALAFALRRCAMRGRPLTTGDLVSTGAATGIHALRSGQHACVRFDGIAELRCRAVPAKISLRRLVRG
jgi:2-keto-4-pentenoate hydratase